MCFNVPRPQTALCILSTPGIDGPREDDDGHEVAHEAEGGHGRQEDPLAVEGDQAVDILVTIFPFINLRIISFKVRKSRGDFSWS